MTGRHNPKKFNIEYEATFESPRDNEIRAWIAQPQNFIFQTIEKFSVFPRPKSQYKDEQGNKILHFSFKNLETIEIKVNIEAILWKHKVDIENKDGSLFKGPFVRYLKNEKFLEQTKETRLLALKLAENDKLALEKTREVFNFVAKNFKYRYPVKQRGVKNLNFKNLQGDCGEYSSLFVAMCRILGIPSRNNTGFVIFPKQKKISEHGWASAYLKPYGWLDFDPQYASLEGGVVAGIKKYFGRRSDYRITFISGFNIPLKPRIPKSFRLDYWNKLGLPLNNNSVQMMQPLVFVSKKKVKFKENIKILKAIN